MTDPELLMEIMEVREALEEATTEEEVSTIRQTNKGELPRCEASLTLPQVADVTLWHRRHARDVCFALHSLRKPTARPRIGQDTPHQAQVPAECRGCVSGMVSWSTHRVTTLVILLSTIVMTTLVNRTVCEIPRHESGCEACSVHAALLSTPLKLVATRLPQDPVFPRRTISLDPQSR